MQEASGKSTMSRLVKMRITRTGEIGPDGSDAANSQLSEYLARFFILLARECTLP
jgi:hypothetical protein